MNTILVVEDEKDIAYAIQALLQTQGYTILIAHNGEEALTIVNQTSIQCAIVDVMMPIMDGYTFVMKVREDYDFPIIMLSAKTEDMDKIMGLQIGADDYVSKPYVPLELLARVQSQLRRYLRYTPVKKEVLTCGELEYNKSTKEVKLNDIVIAFTPIELKLLELLMNYQGRVFSSEELYEKIWKEEAINTETIMVHIRNIRKKIELDSKNPKYIKVVWGIGYKMEKQ